MNGAGGNQTVITYAITAVVVVLVLAIRLRQAGRARPLKIGRLWIVPALYSALTAFAFAHAPPHGVGWFVCAGALLLGCAVGWQRGRMMHIAVDPGTRALSVRHSPWAVLFILLLILLRSGLRGVLASSGTLSVATLTDALIASALGLLTIQRLEMYLRARRLLRSGEAA